MTARNSLLYSAGEQAYPGRNPIKFHALTRCNFMALLKPELPKPSKRDYCIRLEERLALTLERYAEFLGATSNSYVISQALELVFQRDADFKQWLRLNPQLARDREGHKRHPVAAEKAAPSATDSEAGREGKQ